jgi:branched-chain amino acid transport system permease protein
VGAVYAIVAVGFNIVIISSATFNFAQPQLIMLGTFAAYLGAAQFHAPLLVTIAISLVLGGLIGVLIERTAIRLLPPGAHAELVTTVGVSVIIAGVVILAFGNNPFSVPPVFGGDRAMTLLGGRILPAELTILCIGLALPIIADILTTRTLLGLSSLAASEDKTAAVLRGINVGRLGWGSYGLAGALCMGLGPFVAPETYAYSALGDILVLKGFVAMVIGGQGSHRGALIGAIAVGFVEAFTARYIGVNYQNIAVFGLLLIVLMIRPHGLFGERLERAV